MLRTLSRQAWLSNTRQSTFCVLFVPSALRRRRRRILSSVLINTSKALSTDVSAVGFNDYDLGIKEHLLEVPTYFNFAEDVLGKWCLEEQVRYWIYNVQLFRFFFPSYLKTNQIIIFKAFLLKFYFL